MTEERTLTDDYTDDDDLKNDEDAKGGKNENGNIRQLREKADRADAAEAKNLELERKLAFSDLGLPNTKAGDYFRKGYEGDLTPEAIKAEAIEAGLLEAPKNEDEVPPDERKGLEAVQDAAAGGDAVVPPGYAEELDAARSPAEAHAVMVKYGQAVHDLH